MTDDRPTAAELQALLADLLAGAAGGEAGTWATAIGPVTVHPMAFRPRCNWSLEPKGSAAKRAAIDETIAGTDDLRIIDTLIDESSSSWLEEMGATVW